MRVKTEAISPEVMAEILRRREMALEHPELLEPWGDTTERLRAQLNAIHRAELLTDADEISPDVQDELKLRLKEMDEHPEILKPFEAEDVERMIQEAADAHAKKSSIRRS